ncbi:MAG TPA: hypothetical protein VH136_07490 [Trebonia sp.]|jgi:hypothetical protein|nr:hypothetical protein [Trebonia sp.]
MESLDRSADRGQVVTERPPLPYPVALRALAVCFTNTARVLALVSARGSIHYVVLRRLSRDVLLDGPDVLASAPDGTAWWCPAKAA